MNYINPFYIELQETIVGKISKHCSYIYTYKTNEYLFNE